MSSSLTASNSTLSSTFLIWAMLAPLLRSADRRVCLRPSQVLPGKTGRPGGRDTVEGALSRTTQRRHFRHRHGAWPSRSGVRPAGQPPPMVVDQDCYVDHLTDAVDRHPLVSL